MPNLLRGARASAASLLIFFVAALIMLVFLDLRAGLYDEAILLTGGWNVAHGAVPHRDFYANYGPAQFYILAGLFKLAGPSFLAARIYDVIIRAAIVAITYLLLAGRVRPTIALASAGVCLLWLGGSGFYLYPTIPALLFSLAGTLLLLPDEGELPGRKRLATAGACSGVVALFRYDVGFYALAAHAIVILNACGDGPLRARLFAFAKKFIFYALGTGLVFAPPAAALLLLGAGPGFIHDILAYPSEYYIAMRGLPFSGWTEILATPVEAASYIPFAATALAAIFYLRISRRNTDGRVGDRAADKMFLVSLGMLSLFFSLKGLVRFSAIHMILAIIPATILLAFLLDRIRLMPLPGRIAVCVISLVAIAAPYTQALQVARSLATDPSLSLVGRFLGTPARSELGARGVALASAPATMPTETACAGDFIASVTHPGEPIFSGTQRHDKILINNLMIYFGSGRHPATHWYQFDPGLQTRKDIQDQIVNDLKKNNVRWIVTDGNWDDVNEPNQSSKSSGIEFLDNHISSNYRKVIEFKKTTVWLFRNHDFSTDQLRKMPASWRAACLMGMPLISEMPAA